MFKWRHQKRRSDSQSDDQKLNLPKVQRSTTEQSVLGILCYGGLQLRIVRKSVDNLNMIKQCVLQPIKQIEKKMIKVKQLPKLQRVQKDKENDDYTPW